MSSTYVKGGLLSERTAELATRLVKRRGDVIEWDWAYSRVDGVCDQVSWGELCADQASLVLFGDTSASNDILDIVDGGA